MSAEKIDVLLTPTSPTVAHRHGIGADLNSLLSYTYLWNAYDCPAGVVPVDYVKAKDDESENGK